MHLAAGLQVPGFRSLIASKWGMADIDGPILAGLLYGYMLPKERRRESSRAAEALYRHTSQTVRANDISIYRWATFIHTGL